VCISSIQGKNNALNPHSDSSFLELYYSYFVSDFLKWSTSNDRTQKNPSNNFCSEIEMLKLPNWQPQSLQFHLEQLSLYNHFRGLHLIFISIGASAKSLIWNEQFHI
jgi:hypothetical protein